jgi:hypothetical protein
VLFSSGFYTLTTKMHILYFLLLMSAPVLSTAQTNTIIGEWRGTSICQQKNSSCNDETVVYKITSINQKDSFAFAAYKIINGNLDFMGTLNFKYNAQAQTLECIFKENWRWVFKLSRDKMEGTLTKINEKLLYRKIAVSKAK